MDNNLYRAGSHVRAKQFPATDLIVDRYYKRIYYCYEERDTTKKVLPYYERELFIPVNSIL